MISFLPLGIFKSCRTKIEDQEIFSVRSVPKDGKAPVLFIHGALVSHLYFMPVAAILAHNYQVLVPDLPGHGESSKPEDALPVETQARMLRAWLAESGIERVTVLAHSYGCAIAVQMAIEYPELIGRLIFIGPAADPSTPLLFLQAVRLIMDGFYEHPAMFLILMRDTFCTNLKRSIQTAEIMIGFDYLPKLPLIPIKTLVVRGENDPLASQKWVDKFVSSLPDARLIVIENSPHNVQFAKPEVVAEAVTRFLEES